MGIRKCRYLLNPFRSNTHGHTHTTSSCVRFDHKMRQNPQSTISLLVDCQFETTLSDGSKYRCSSTCCFVVCLFSKAHLNMASKLPSSRGRSLHHFDNNNRIVRSTYGLRLNHQSATRTIRLFFHHAMTTQSHYILTY